MQRKRLYSLGNIQFLLHSAPPHCLHLHCKIHASATNLVVSAVAVGAALEHLEVLRVLSHLTVLGEAGGNSDTEEQEHRPAGENMQRKLEMPFSPKLLQTV